MVVEVPWKRLIRFISDEDGQIHFGDAIAPSPDFDVGAPENADRLEAKPIHGDPLSSAYTVDDRIVKVRKLLGPLTRDMVPALRCIGGNYKTHSECLITFIPISKY